MIDKLENSLTNHGHKDIWTPPYIPETQPIETFLVERKGYAAQNYIAGQPMRETIINLRDGWYGNIIAPTPGVEAPAIIRGSFSVV